jgi:hypothetical protein
MAMNSFDVTKLSAVRKRAKSKSCLTGTTTKRKTTEEENSSPLPSNTLLQQQQEAELDDDLRRVALSFKRGDYELYKSKQQQQQQRHHHQLLLSVEDDDSLMCTSTSCGSSTGSQTMPQTQQQQQQQRRLVQQHVLDRERTIEEYRRRIREQEIEVDALYAQLSKTQRLIGDLNYSRGALIENLCVVVVKEGGGGESLLEMPPSSSFGFGTLVLLLKLAMLFGLLVHWVDGSPHCLATAVFGWWMTESFT